MQTDRLRLLGCAKVIKRSMNAHACAHPRRQLLTGSSEYKVCSDLSGFPEMNLLRGRIDRSWQTCIIPPVLVNKPSARHAAWPRSGWFFIHLEKCTPPLKHGEKRVQTGLFSLIKLKNKSFLCWQRCGINKINYTTVICWWQHTAKLLLINYIVANATLNSPLCYGSFYQWAQGSHKKPSINRHFLLKSISQAKEKKTLENPSPPDLHLLTSVSKNRRKALFFLMLLRRA